MLEKRRGMTSFLAISKKINDVREAAGQQKKNINYDKVEYHHLISEICPISPEEKEKGIKGKTEGFSSKEKKLNQNQAQLSQRCCSIKNQ